MNIKQTIFISIVMTVVAVICLVIANIISGGEKVRVRNTLQDALGIVVAVWLIYLIEKGVSI